MDDTAKLVSPPNWSLWIGDIGRYSILLAAIAFSLCALGWAFGYRNLLSKKVAGLSLTLGVLLLFCAFVILGVLLAGNRFEYSYVFQHGDTSNALQYRIAGIWSGQQGSFLLWACCAGLFAILTAKGTQRFRRWYSVAYSTFLAGLAGIMVFESPFDLNNVGGLTVVPPNGAGLAPSLQNYWVTIHPPTIFLGFGALTVMFAYAFAALMERDSTEWIRLVRPWALVSVAVLGLGLCMGGFWAYETLGWGGFWMWDPVENVSFVPWCLTIAFIHGIIIQTARGTKATGNLLMGGLPFLTFMYGTFLTRSGFLSDASVHSFAEMNRSALKLLIGLMVLSATAFFGVLILRAVQARRNASPKLEEAPKTSYLGREAMLNAGIASVSAIGIATMIGMCIPFVQALKHQPSKVVEEGLYHQVLTWFFIPTLILMAVAPFAPWRNVSAKQMLSRAYSILCITVGATGLFLIVLVFSPFGKVIDKSPVVTLLGRHGLPGFSWLLLLFSVCFFAIAGNLWRIWELRKQSSLGWSGFLAHIGVAVLMVGLIISRGFEQKDQIIVMKDHPGKALGYSFAYRKMTSNDKDRFNKVLFDVSSVDSPKDLLFTADPGMYKVPSEGGQENTMVWPAIIHKPLYDVYVSLRPPQDEVSEPVAIQEGKSTEFGGLQIDYKGLKMDGQPGAAGTKFVANLVVHAGGLTKEVHPSLQIGEEGPVHSKAALDDNLNVEVASINAADRSVTLQFQLATPMFPIDVIHKPMTCLVWIGTGLMTLAGLLAAAYRRVPSMARVADKSKVAVNPKDRRLAKQNS